MKRLWAALVALCLLLGSCGESGPTQETERPQDYETVVMAFPVEARDQELLESVQTRMNSILEEKLGIRVKFLTFPNKNYHKEMLKVLAGTNQVDVMLCLGTYVEDWLSGNLLPLGKLLAKYGQEAVNAVTEDVIRSCAVDSEIFGIPNVRDYAVTTDTYCLNTAILERNGFSADAIQTMEDLERVFTAIHRNEPDVVILSNNLLSVAANRRYLNPQIQTLYIGVLDEAQDRYINYFATEEYRALLNRIREWNQKGYVGFYSEAGEIKSPSGVVLAEVRCGKPGVEVEVSQQRGELYQAVCFGDSIITQGAYTTFMYTITKNTASPERSMRLLNELYQNSELNELLSELLGTWMLPNLFLTEVPEGYPEDLWEQTRNFNLEAEQMPDVGFFFDPMIVMQEYLEVLGIYQRYRPVLENGIVDPGEALPHMLEELEEAGIDKVIAEENRQYAYWKEAKNS